MSFAFSFAGDDIDEDELPGATLPSQPAETPAAPSSAFPVAGKPLLPSARHDLSQMLAQLPSKVAYGMLDVQLDSGETIALPRRELWDVRVQLMAEDDNGGDEAESGLGTHDVKTGVYEGGFKSWESSVDLVKVLEPSKPSLTAPQGEVPCVVELGCGTALPSLAIFQWLASAPPQAGPVTLILADYNATVLQLVTLPNFIVSWALAHAVGLPVVAEALASVEGELELTPGVLQAFQDFLASRKINLQFLSGGWSPEFVELVKNAQDALGTGETKQKMVILGAETIYSPFALQSFTEVIFSLMEHQRSLGNNAEVVAAAKRMYFGVGGSLDDFVDKARGLGAVVDQLREETQGVRRGVVRCYLPA